MPVGRSELLGFVFINEKPLLYGRGFFCILLYSGMARLLFGLAIAVLLSSCQTVFQGLYGIRNLRAISTSELRSTAAQYGIPTTNLAVLDTSYRTFLIGARQRDSVVVKDHYQPLQASYYDKAGQLRVFHVNCYAGGFPNLNWQYQGRFNQFPPSPQATTDTLLSLPVYLRYLRNSNGQHLPPFPATDHTVVVQWSRFMGRQSRRLIKLVQHNAFLAQLQGQSVQLLFVNNDNFQAFISEQQVTKQTK